MGYWIAAMIPFVYIVYALLVGLSSATESEQDPAVRNLIKFAQKATVVSWCTYPVVYVFPMLGISGGNVVVLIQLGYSCSDIISKCGVGLLIYSITMAKSAAIRAGNEETPLYGTKGNFGASVSLTRATRACLVTFSPLSLPTLIGVSVFFLDHFGVWSSIELSPSSYGKPLSMILERVLPPSKTSAGGGV